MILGSIMLKKLNTKSKTANIVGLVFAIDISLRVGLENFFIKT